MSTYKTPSKPKTQHDTRPQAMDDFKYIIQIIDIELNSKLERALQTERIQSIRHILWIKDDFLNNLEYKKEDQNLPVPIFQITSLSLFIEYCKYRKMLVILLRITSY